MGYEVSSGSTGRLLCVEDFPSATQKEPINGVVVVLIAQPVICQRPTDYVKEKRPRVHWLYQRKGTASVPFFLPGLRQLQNHLEDSHSLGVCVRTVVPEDSPTCC